MKTKSSQSSSSENEETGGDRTSPMAKTGCIMPIVGIVITVIVAFGASIPDSDWLGMSIFARLIVGTMICSIVSIFFSIISFRYKEPKAYLTLLLSLPAGVFLLFIIGSFIKYSFLE